MATTLHFEDFEASSTLPSGWSFATGYAIDTTSKMTGVNALAIAAGSGFGAVYVTQDGVSGNDEVSVDFRVDNPGTSSQINFYSRSNVLDNANINAATSTYYRALINVGSTPAAWQIVKRVSGTNTSPAIASTPPVLAAATAYTAYLTCNGATSPGTTVSMSIQRKSDGFWMNSNGTTWQATRTPYLEYTDTGAPITGPGYAGISQGLAAGATAYFDNFTLTDYHDTATYTKLWTDVTNFTAGVGTPTAGLFNGGVDAGLVLASGSALTTTSGFNDRQYSNTLTGYFPFIQQSYAVGTSPRYILRGFQLTFAGVTSIDLGVPGGGTTLATVPFTAANWTNGRTYILYFRIDAAKAQFTVKDTVAGTYLQSTGAFAATFAWAIDFTTTARPPGSTIQIYNSGGANLTIGPIKLGPCGTPQVTPSSVTVSVSGTQVFAPLYFTGVDTVDTATLGTFSGNTYHAPGSGGSDTATFASLVGSDSVTAAITVSNVAAATTYAITGPTSGRTGITSASFIVTPDGTSAATVTITPSGGGLSTPITVTFDGTATAKTFTLTPTSVGTVTLTPTNGATLINPAASSYAVLLSATSTYKLLLPAAPTAAAASTVRALFDWPLIVDTTITLVDDNGTFPNGSNLVVPAGSVYGSVEWTPTTSGAHTFGVAHTGQAGITDPVSGLSSTVAASITPSTGGDWTDAEVAQFRFRFGIAGTQAVPNAQSRITLPAVAPVVPVDHDTGGTGALTYTDDNHVGVAGSIRAFKVTDFEAGRRADTYVTGRTQTRSDGTWLTPMMLAPGDYVLLMTPAGGYSFIRRNVTVAY